MEFDGRRFYWHSASAPLLGRARLAPLAIGHAACANLTDELNIVPAILGGSSDEAALRLGRSRRRRADGLRGRGHGIFAGGLPTTDVRRNRLVANRHIRRHDHRLREHGLGSFWLGGIDRSLRPDGRRTVGWSPAWHGPRAGKSSHQPSRVPAYLWRHRRRFGGRGLRADDRYGDGLVRHA